jgi:hypothetical protein
MLLSAKSLKRQTKKQKLRKVSSVVYVCGGQTRCSSQACSAVVPLRKLLSAFVFHAHEALSRRFPLFSAVERSNKKTKHTHTFIECMLPHYRGARMRLL